MVSAFASSLRWINSLLLLHPIFFHGGPDDDEFSIEMHHGGVFCGSGSNRTYVDEKADLFDNCESDSWSLLWIDDFIEEMGHTKTEKTKFYLLLPGKQISDGLRRLRSDADSNSMVALIPRFRNLVVYVDHQDIMDNINWDELAISSMVPLPVMMSPKTALVVEKRANKNSIDVETASDGAALPINDHDEDIEADPNFVDSDYEIDQGDDDLFTSVDKNVQDCISFASKDTGVVLEDESFNDASFGDEGLDLPESSDDEDSIKLSFKNFQPVDMESPQFSVGMIFGSVQEVREAIKQYSIKNRVAIKTPRNNKIRVEAFCTVGCPWQLTASADSRAKKKISQPCRKLFPAT